MSNWFRIPNKDIPPKLKKALLEVACALGELGECAPYGGRSFYSGSRLSKFSQDKLRIKVHYHHINNINDAGGGWAEYVVDAKVKYKHRMFLKCRYGTSNNWIIHCKVDLDKLKLLADVAQACMEMVERRRDERAKQKKCRAELLESKLGDLGEGSG